MLKLFAKCSSGSVAFEYAMIAGLVSVAIIAGVSTVGSSNTEIYNEVDKNISSATK